MRVVVPGIAKELQNIQFVYLRDETRRVLLSSSEKPPRDGSVCDDAWLRTVPLLTCRLRRTRPPNLMQKPDRRGAAPTPKNLFERKNRWISLVHDDGDDACHEEEEEGRRIPDGAEEHEDPGEVMLFARTKEASQNLGSPTATHDLEVSLGGARALAAIMAMPLLVVAEEDKDDEDKDDDDKDKDKDRGETTLVSLDRYERSHGPSVGRDSLPKM